MLIDKEIILIVKNLLDFYLKIIKTEKPQNLIPILDQDYNFLLNITVEMKQNLISKGVVTNKEGIEIPLHLYPLSLVILDLDPNIKEAILKYLSSYQSVLKFNSK